MVLARMFGDNGHVRSARLEDVQQLVETNIGSDYNRLAVHKVIQRSVIVRIADDQTLDQQQAFDVVARLVEHGNA